MSTEHYEAVLADLEARKGQLEAAIAAIRLIMGQPQAEGGGGFIPSGPSGGSIPEATKKHQQSPPSRDT